MSPTSLTFGNTVQATAATQIIWLNNPNSSALKLTGTGQGISINGPNASSFTQTNTCGTSVAPGASCTITVTFTPSAIGPLSAEVWITGSVSVFPFSQSRVGPKGIPLNGTGMTQTGVIGDCGMDQDGALGTVDFVKVYQSQLSEWCINANLYSTYYTTFLNGPFYAYSDAVITELNRVFPVTPPNQPFIVEVQQSGGGGVAGCGLGGGSYCNTVTGNAYYNVFTDPVTQTNITGFWGYLFTLHEAINVYTAMVSPGWPTDWWCDNRTTFANAYDYEILQDMGTAQNNQTLLNSATAQYNLKANQSQNPSGYDPEVALFIDFFHEYCEGTPCSGFPAYTRVFKLIAEDGISWPNVSGYTNYNGDNDYSARLTEYVIAYLQMGFRGKPVRGLEPPFLTTTTDQTQNFVRAGVGSAANAPPGESAYTIDTRVVGDIETAHCSIQAAKRAGRPYAQQLANLQSGDYKHAIATGGTKASCPDECAWNATQSKCLPR